MQYLEGETLADRLARQPLTLEETFAAATQIASELNAAHRAGIVHRDLKPGNVMLTKNGVKLLDFGLAKTVAAPQPVAAVSIAATRPAPLTQKGSLLGTLQYMSPEQLEGRDAHARSDIFAFGAFSTRC
jgi:serine/threonine protein kinase